MGSTLPHQLPMEKITYRLLAALLFSLEVPVSEMPLAYLNDTELARTLELVLKNRSNYREEENSTKVETLCICSKY